MLLTYGYFGGSLIFLAVWFAIYLNRKDLRREIVWASLLGMPFGVIEMLFVPHYWLPASLFDLMRHYGFGIEGFIYSFSVSGLSAVIYEFVERKREVKIRRDRGFHPGPFIVFLAVYLVLEIIYPQKPMLDLSVAFVCGALMTAAMRPDLILHILTGSILFGVIYIALFAFINALFGDIVGAFYQPQIFGNFKLLGVPLEEIIGAFAGGAFWSTLYEYVRGYRERRLALAHS